MLLEIVTRQAWGAVEARGPPELKGPATNVFLAYTGHQECSGYQCRTYIAQEQDKHMSFRRLPDIAYSYLIDTNGVIYEGRGSTVAPTLPLKYRFVEFKSLYIGFFGSFVDNPPSDEMFRAREEFLKYCVNHNFITHNYRSIII